MSLAMLLMLPATISMAQTGMRRAGTKSRVLDLVFAQGATTESYLSRLTMRFGDSDTQLVVSVYPPYPVRPGGRVEIIRYSLEGMGSGALEQLVSKMVAENPDVTDREIAAKLKVTAARSPIDFDALQRSLNDLKAIRISPVLASRVFVDEYSEYEFWYDAGQESVHYTLQGPSKDAPQDQLVLWMIKFRSSLPAMEKPSAKKLHGTGRDRRFIQNNDAIPAKAARVKQ